MRNFSGRALLGASLILGFAAFAPRSAPAAPALPGGFQDTVVLDGLEQPTAFRFAPDGRVFVAEKAGRIEVFDDLEDPSPEVFADLRTQVYDHGDRGLLGIALDPGFEEGRPYVYALYTYDHILGEEAAAPRWGSPETTGDSCPEPKGADDCVVSGRLTRLTVAEGESKAVEIEGAPLEEELVADWCQQFSSHSIGDLRFGPEGALYASGGDGASFTGADYGQLGEPPNPCGDPPGGFGVELTPPSAEGGSLRAQNLESLSGSIVRLDPDTGEAWPDNPLVASPNENTRRIVAHGFRNPFRLAIDPQTGEIYIGNVGSSEIEEIDRFAVPPQQVYNSGWPCYEGPERQFLFEPLELDVCESLYEAEPGSTSPPLFYYSHGQEVVAGDECPFASGSALSGLAFYEGGEYPEGYEGALFFSDSVRGCIYAMFQGEDGRPDPLTTEVFMREGQIYPGVDIEEGSDGALYYASLFGDEEYGPGAIHRISYVPGAPTARLKADPQWGPVEPEPLQVNLDASESGDPDEEPLEFEWDLDGDGTFEAPGGESKALEFTKEELEEDEEQEESLNSVIAVRVTDEGGLSSVARITVYPGAEPPDVAIDVPDEGEDTWGVGEEIGFDGSAHDFEGASLPGLSFHWSMRLAHCPSGPENCHKHPLQTVAGLQFGSFLAPDHDYPSYIEITLRVTDGRGLSASDTVTIDPRTVDLEIASSPPGIQLTAGLKAAAAPFTLKSIEDSEVVLSAPQNAQLEGGSYEWQGWSDGGARVHAVVADEPASYEALYSEVVDPVPPAGDPSAQSEPRLPDSAPPQTTLRRHPPKSTARRDARFAFVASERGSRFRCKLDRGRFRACGSPKVYRRLGPGWHAFRVLAVDAAGNEDATPASFRWRIVCSTARARPFSSVPRRGVFAAAPRYSAATSVCQVGRTGRS